MTFDIAICGGILLSSHNGYQPVIGSLGIKDGKIEYFGEEKITKKETKELMNAYGKIVMPGLVNGHCHGDMAIGKGLGDDLTLLEQMNLFRDTNWFYDLISDEDRYYARKLTYVEALLSGTTFLLENMYWGLGELSHTAMAEVGIKGGLVEDIRTDFSKPDELISEEAMRGFGERCLRYGQLPLIGNISEEDFTAERLRKNKALADRLGFYETRHLAETTWRVKMIQDQYGTTPVDYLFETGALHERMIGSHAVYIGVEEIQAMAECGVKVVNTPLCEMKIADGIAPIPAFLKYGITVGLGTDGAMWNNSNDIFREMKGMALLHSVNSGIRSLSAKDVLDMGTIQGARVFGKEDEFGTLEAGKSADVILVDADQPHLAPLRIQNKENVSSAMVFCATGRDVTDVLINGEPVVENRRLIGVNVPEILERVNAVSERIAACYR